MKRKDALSSDPRTIDLVSDDRWRLHCRVERIGDDLLCRLGGGDEHVGAVALAQWEVGRARTECLIVGHHREKELALHAAHRLCKASRRSAVCIAGIHFDDLTANEVQAVSRAADRLTKQAAKLVEDEREHLAVSESSILARIESGAPELKEKIESFLRRPLDDLRSEHRAAIDSWAGEAIELFAPLYLSNACMNDCEYCGFRRSEHFPRTTLDREEALAQARYLAGQGHDSIELVTGEVPTPQFVEYIAGFCESLLTQRPAARVGLNVGALDEAQYRRLRAAGAIDARIYQESYDQDVYFRVHRGGPKRDMAQRLAAPHRVARAGLPTVGLGILLGLAPLAAELARLCRHAEILREDFPEIGIDFSLPRIRPLRGSVPGHAAHVVEDEALMKAFLYLRLRFPTAELTLSTRESPLLRDALLPLGISRLSAGVSTAPGGYCAECASAVEQFKISDTRSYAEIAETVRRAKRAVASR
jgi:2-iminoacetate synthase